MNNPRREREREAGGLLWLIGRGGWLAGWLVGWFGSLVCPAERDNHPGKPVRQETRTGLEWRWGGGDAGLVHPEGDGIQGFLWDIYGLLASSIEQNFNLYP
jgi:hypothetical protein